jgi:hypothetical protein
LHLHYTALSFCHGCLFPMLVAVGISHLLSHVTAPTPQHPTTPT